MHSHYFHSVTATGTAASVSASLPPCSVSWTLTDIQAWGGVACWSLMNIFSGGRLEGSKRNLKFQSAMWHHFLAHVKRVRKLNHFKAPWALPKFSNHNPHALGLFIQRLFNLLALPTQQGKDIMFMVHSHLMLSRC
jgi:hypothetical protein